jgi:hypothetical protein
MIKLKIGRNSTHIHLDSNGSYSRAAGGNNVEAPVDDDGRDGSDQERAIGDSGDQDAQQRASQQENGDSTDFQSTAKGAAGHRSGAPGGASSDEDSNVSADAGNPQGRGAGKDKGPLKRDDKDSHSGMSLDEEAKERMADEGGPAPNSGARRGELDAPTTDRGGTYSKSNNGHGPGRH